MVVGQDRHPAHTPACTSRVCAACVRCMSLLACLCRACLASRPVLVHLCRPGATQHRAPAPSATPPLLFFFQSLLHHLPPPTQTIACHRHGGRECEAPRLRVSSCALSSVNWNGRTVCRRVCLRAVGCGERLCCGAAQHPRAPVRWCRRLCSGSCVCVAQARHIGQPC